MNHRQISLFIAVILFLFSVIISPSFVGKYFSSDGELNNSLIKIEITVVRSIFFLLGMMFIFNRTYLSILFFLKNRYKEIVLLVCMILIMLIVGEIILRVNGVLFNRYLRFDKVYHHVFIPDSSGILNALEFKTKYSINSFGLRDREYDVKKPKNVYRIMMLGDSFTEGFGVEANETFSKIIEKRLNKELTYSNFSFEVINAGVESYSPTLEYLWMKNEGIKFEPDLVILNFDQNDIVGDLIMQKAGMFENDELIAVDGTKDIKGESLLFKRVSKNSYLLDALWNLHAYFTINNATTALKNEKIFPQLFTEKKYNETECLDHYYYINYTSTVENDILFWHRYDFPINETAPYNNSLNYVNKLKFFLDKKNVSFLLTTYPYGNQVNLNEWKIGRTFWCASPNKVYSIESCTFLENYAKENNISVFNSCPLFRNYNETPKLYFDLDYHFTFEGHKFFADIIYNVVLKEIKQSH